MFRVTFFFYLQTQFVDVFVMALPKEKNSTVLTIVLNVAIGTIALGWYLGSRAATSSISKVISPTLSKTNFLQRTIFLHRFCSGLKVSLTEMTKSRYLSPVTCTCFILRLRRLDEIESSKAGRSVCFCMYL